MSAVAVNGAYQGQATYAEHPQQDLRPTLLVTTVDIGEGRSGRIELRLGDDPIDVAHAFCQRHGLPETIVVPLAQHLEDNLAENAAVGHAGGHEEQRFDEASEQSDQEEPLPLPDCSAPSSGERRRQSASPPSTSDVAVSRDASLAAAAAAAAAAALYTDARVQVSAHSTGSMGRPHGRGEAPVGSSQPALKQQVEPSSRSAGNLGPHSHVAAAAQQRQQHEQRAGQRSTRTQSPVPAESPTASEGQQLPTYRPACVNSSRGAEYYNRPPSSARSAGTAQSDGLYYTGSGSVPAHNRLYADHFRKQQRLEEERRLRDLEIQLKTEQVHIAAASNKLASHRTTGSYRNYGERLYVEGRLDAMKKEQTAQRVKDEEERAELEQYTFQPEITRMAQQIKKTEEEMGAVSAYQRLYQRGSDGAAKRMVGYGGLTTEERMAAIRREQEEAEVKECSFRPQICNKSARMVEQRQQILRESGMTGFEQLYNESLRRKIKLEQLAQLPPEEATFHPQVNTSSVVLKKLMEGRQADGPLGGSADVAVRLLERGRKYQEKLESVQRLQEEQPRDAATGQPLFRPKTHRAPHYSRNPEGAPIGEYLYSIKAEWDEKAAQVQDANERRKQQNAASTFVNSRSEILVDRLKRERFRAIFDYLRRGHPAPVLNLLETVQDEAFMDTIDPEVRADIEFAGRLLAKAITRRTAAELQDCATSAPDGSSAAVFAHSTNGELDASGFVALMEDVIARTKGLTRQYLLPMPSARQKFEEPSFRPVIDPRSQALAARLRPATLPTHELLYKTAEENATKRVDAKRASDAAKLKECLFHPVMVSQTKAKEGRAMKMTATLTQSKRPTEDEEGGAAHEVASRAAAQQAPATGAKLHRAAAEVAAAADADASNDRATAGNGSGNGGGGEQLHFDALERQINEALVRLSLTEEQVAASLHQAATAGEAPAPLQVGQSVDANGYRLDFRAICGTPTPDSMTAFPETSSMAGFNPLDDAEAGSVSRNGAALNWTDDSEHHVVAHVMKGREGEEEAADLLGLDLHALASTDLPEHALLQPHAAACGAAGTRVQEGPWQQELAEEQQWQWQRQQREAGNPLLISPLSTASPAHSEMY